LQEDREIEIAFLGIGHVGAALADGLTALCADLGWEPVDADDISTSLHLEHMTLLWIKMARAQGRGPDFVWAR
jgi:predicted dinucleotide-binding enzyme